MDFTGRVVMITGAAGNLGRAVAQVFAERGATLALVNRHRASLESIFGADDERRLLLPADLLDQQQTSAAVSTALARFERIDVLCNLAGGFRSGPTVHETPDADWSFMFDINVRTLIHAARAVVPSIEHGGGKVVNVGAFSAQKGAAGMGAYGAAKAGVIRLTESMAAELRKRNINVNCVLPTAIDTPENRAAMPGSDPSRWVAPEDLAKAIAFLASDDARAIHGAALPVTGLS